jgi:hypothetical protein
MTSGRYFHKLWTSLEVISHRVNNFSLPRSGSPIKLVTVALGQAHQYTKIKMSESRKRAGDALFLGVNRAGRIAHCA